MNKIYKSYGFTEIYTDHSNLIIDHGGNMGNSVERDVKPNTDKILGKGAFDFLSKYGKPFKDKFGNVHSSPDYSYVLIIPIRFYQKWLAQRKLRETQSKRLSKTKKQTEVTPMSGCPRGGDAGRRC
jgi:hypothetical protein